LQARAGVQYSGDVQLVVGPDFDFVEIPLIRLKRIASFFVGPAGPCHLCREDRTRSLWIGEGAPRAATWASSGDEGGRRLSVPKDLSQRRPAFVRSLVRHRCCTAIRLC
jgi:hypothetical protein